MSSRNRNYVVLFQKLKAKRARYVYEKILLSLLTSLIVSGALMSDMYVGVEYGAALSKTKIKDDFGSVKGDNDYKDIKRKFGAGSDGESKTQVTLSFISFDEKIFDNKNNDLIEIGIDAINKFEVTKNFYPFLKTGVDFGFMDIEGYNKNRIRELYFNIGVGISYKVIDHIYLVSGIDYVDRKWQNIEKIVTFARKKMLFQQEIQNLSPILV